MAAGNGPMNYTTMIARTFGLNIAIVERAEKWCEDNGVRFDMLVAVALDQFLDRDDADKREARL